MPSAFWTHIKAFDTFRACEDYRLLRISAIKYGLPAHLVEAVIRADSDRDRKDIEGTVRDFADLLHRYSGNLRLALAANHAGDEAVRSHGGVPPYPETIAYVERLVTAYEAGATDGATAPADWKRAQCLPQR